MKPFKKEKYKSSIISNELKYYDDENEIEWYGYSPKFEYNFYYEYNFYEVDVLNIYQSFTYIYIPDIDKFSIHIDRVKNNGYDDFLIYTDMDDIIHLDVCVYSSGSKIEAFFGCVLKIIMYSEKYSEKIKRIYNYLYQKYPEIYFSLIGHKF